MGDKLFLTRVFIFLFVIFASVSPILAFGGNQTPVRILYIGSSYINFNNLPKIVEDLAVNAGKEIFYDSDRVINGKYLDFHAASLETAEKIAESNWDYVVLQGAGPNLAYPNEFPGHPVLPSLVNLEQKIHSNSPSAKMIYFMPRAFEDGMIWYNGWSDTFFDMQQIIYDKTMEMAAQVDFAIAPMGWAFREVLSENHMLHYLYGSDFNHPNYRGSYLMACVLYSTIFLETTEGITEYGNLPEQEAVNLQQIGSSVVLDNLELWKLVPTDVEDNSGELLFNFQLYQNYPNPFNGYTRIGFQIESPENISITVYDSLGRKIRTLLKSEVSAGQHYVDFNANNLSSGIYFYEINNGRNILTKPMLLLK